MVGNPSDGSNVSHKPYMKGHVPQPRMDALNEGDVIRVAVHDLAQMDCGEFATVSRQQLWQESEKCLVFLFAFGQYGRRNINWDGRWN